MSDNFKKELATFLAVVTASVIVLSVSYIVKEANHDCTGKECPVCVCIEQCLNNFRTLGTGVEVQAEIFIVENFLVSTILLYICLQVPVTLTNQKIRLND